MKNKNYMLWINLIAVVICVPLVIFLFAKQKAPDTNATEPVQTETVAVQQPEAPKTSYPQIDEIEYYFEDGTYGGQPAALLSYKNNSQYTITSVQLYFKMKADATQAERDLFASLVNSGDLTLDALSALSPTFISKIVCDPGETGEGAPCNLLDGIYATDVKQCQALTLNGASISFLGKDGSIYTVDYSAKNDTHTLQKATKAAKKWSTKYFTQVTPKPNTRFVTVNVDLNSDFQFVAYDMTLVQFQNYCSECYAAGFSNDVVVSNSAFTGTNNWGLTLNLRYHPAEQAVSGTAAGKKAQPNNPVDPPAYTVEDIKSWYQPILDEQVSQYLEADDSWTRVYQLMYSTQDTVIPVFMPALKPFSDDAIACQRDMEQDLKAELEGIALAVAEKVEPMTICITFDAYLNGDVLSIVIRSESSYDSRMYYTYNFDVTTGKRLDKAAFVEKMQITNLDERLQKTAQNGFEAEYGPVGDSGNAGDFKQQQLNATIDPANLEKTQFFVGPDGNVMTVMNIYAMAGASSYYKLVPLA